ncbi:MAG: hypothetical protein MZV64_69600 [Ignavibacteriales bacterium]|nr:hypothetical protein [Ignavibacteriales bacterium]
MVTNVIDPTATYTVTANEFVPLILNMLGIPFTNLQVLTGQTEFQTLTEYVIAQGGLIYPKTLGRVTNVDSRMLASNLNSELEYLILRQEVTYQIQLKPER